MEWRDSHQTYFLETKCFGFLFTKCCPDIPVSVQLYHCDDDDNDDDDDDNNNKENDTVQHI